MIIWINGPYGVGKSTLVEALSKRIQPSFIFDAEKVGDAVRDNFPPQFFRETYEEYPLWSEICCSLLKELDAVCGGCVLVPMTLVRQESCISIFETLKRQGIGVKHILLDADNETIHDRILARGEEEGCWCMEQIGKCLDCQAELPCDCRLASAGRSVEELAEQVVHILRTAEP